MSNQPNASATWFHKADGDLFAATTVQKNSDPQSPHWDIVLFHAHQAIEKYLKGCLAAKLVLIPKTHDLPGLLRLCLQFVPELLALEPKCDVVNRLYIGSRYPGIRDITEPDARDAIESALAVRKSVLGRLQP
jgi:HEPN domain-containing protein